jgi:hypothetical protein
MVIINRLNNVGLVASLTNLPSLIQVLPLVILVWAGTSTG